MSSGVRIVSMDSMNFLSLYSTALKNVMLLAAVKKCSVFVLMRNFKTL